MFKDTLFEMENEIFPTNYKKLKNEIHSSNKTQEKAFTGMKTYHGDELQPYMLERIGDVIQTENIAKFKW